MEAGNRKNMSFICFGGEDWWYHNRGHFDMQLMRRFARIGKTLYINSIVMQKPNLKKNTGGGLSFTHKLFRKTRSILAGLQKSDAGFWVYSPFSLPVHHLSGIGRLNEIVLRSQIRHVVNRLGLDNLLVWVACPVACETAIRMRKSFFVYQRTDRYEEYPNVDSDAVRTYDRKLKASAGLTVFVSRMLFDEEKDQCRKAIYIDHGVDFEVLSTAQTSLSRPADMADISRPIVGFFGGIDDHTSDIALVRKVVELLAEMSFVFVGKVSADVSSLREKKNVWFPGQKPYEQIPDYGKCFDVAIMPWRKGRWIEACNPVKLKEYLALGKPVVSTPFPELEKYRDVVYEAGTPEEFAECIRQALAEDNCKRIAARRKKVEKASWDSKAQLLLETLFEGEYVD
jgi:glycosyltransferase involved in cell wall biosynthesis